MDIIPVIDLMQGHVVHARRGERDRYRPLVSSLCGSSRIGDVVQGLLGLYPFKKLYIADLDAITGQGNHAEHIRRIRQTYPYLQIWLDSGLTTTAEVMAWDALEVRCVIGSERLNGIGHYLDLAGSCSAEPILSLDFNAAGFLGPADLLRQSSLWPGQVICMSLARVGSDEGPDTQCLSGLQTQRPAGQWYAAGGIRDCDDLLQLQSTGIAGALMASALHNGRLSRELIAKLN